MVNDKDLDKAEKKILDNVFGYSYMNALNKLTSVHEIMETLKNSHDLTVEKLPIKKRCKHCKKYNHYVVPILVWDKNTKKAVLKAITDGIQQIKPLWNKIKNSIDGAVDGVIKDFTKVLSDVDKEKITDKDFEAEDINMCEGMKLEKKGDDKND